MTNSSKAPARLHSALDAVLDAQSAMAKDREPTIEEEKAFDMGEVDGRNGSQQNPNPDWPNRIKAVYREGYKRGESYRRDKKVKDGVPADCLDLSTLAL